MDIYVNDLFSLTMSLELQNYNILQRAYVYICLYIYIWLVFYCTFYTGYISSHTSKPQI